MSGHSKWSTIKRKKGALDAKRGAEFTKLARFIEVAAKSGADPDMNFRLKLAIQKARAANMPATNIDKAVRKGAGLDKDKSSIEEITYEGLGPGNVAVMIQSLTDNKNRTVSELRNIFTKHGGSLGNSGSVAWQFASKGILAVPKGDPELELKAIDAGAEDIQDNGDAWEVHTKPTELNQVKQSLAGAGVETTEDKLALVPTNSVKITDSTVAQKVLNFMDALEENEDVVEIFSNFDIDDSILQDLV
jgi:YebC/PmpR family DNA-binding regulatory protein